VSEIMLPARTGPSIARGKSEQDVGTPRIFLDAVTARFGTITFDLAATAGNAVTEAPWYFGPDHPQADHRDSLAANWGHRAGNLWLNPPFSSIAPWAEKCARESAARHAWTFLLVPASVGANWFVDHVFGKSLVLFLNGRITFVGSTQPYPKDLMLACYGAQATGCATWRWR
jgi:phage N-6-adenine-methyltransferase